MEMLTQSIIIFPEYRLVVLGFFNVRRKNLGHIANRILCLIQGAIIIYLYSYNPKMPWKQFMERASYMKFAYKIYERSSVPPYHQLLMVNLIHIYKLNCFGSI